MGQRPKASTSLQLPEMATLQEIGAAALPVAPSPARADSGRPPGSQLWRTGSIQHHGRWRARNGAVYRLTLVGGAERTMGDTLCQDRKPVLAPQAEEAGSEETRTIETNPLEPLYPKSARRANPVVR